MKGLFEFQDKESMDHQSYWNSSSGDTEYSWQKISHPKSKLSTSWWHWVLRNHQNHLHSSTGEHEFQQLTLPSLQPVAGVANKNTCDIENHKDSVQYKIQITKNILESSSYESPLDEPRQCWVWWWGWRCVECQRHWPDSCREIWGRDARPVSAVKPGCPPEGLCTTLKGRHWWYKTVCMCITIWLLIR